MDVSVARGICGGGTTINLHSSFLIPRKITTNDVAANMLRASEMKRNETKCEGSSTTAGLGSASACYYLHFTNRNSAGANARAQLFEHFCSS